MKLQCIVFFEVDVTLCEILFNLFVFATVNLMQNV